MDNVYWTISLRQFKKYDVKHASVCVSVAVSAKFNTIDQLKYVVVVSTWLECGEFHKNKKKK